MVILYTNMNVLTLILTFAIIITLPSAIADTFQPQLGDIKPNDGSSFSIGLNDNPELILFRDIGYPDASILPGVENNHILHIQQIDLTNLKIMPAYSDPGEGYLDGLELSDSTTPADIYVNINQQLKQQMAEKVNEPDGGPASWWENFYNYMKDKLGIGNPEDGDPENKEDKAKNDYEKPQGHRPGLARDPIAFKATNYQTIHEYRVWNDQWYYWDKEGHPNQAFLNYLDVDCDGKYDKVDRKHPGTLMLFVDLDMNNKVTCGYELLAFEDISAYDALSVFDDNKDWRIDSKDQIWNFVKVTDNLGNIFTLDYFEVKAIYLNDLDPGDDCTGVGWFSDMDYSVWSHYPDNMFEDCFDSEKMSHLPKISDDHFAVHSYHPYGIQFEDDSFTPSYGLGYFVWPDHTIHG